MDTAAYLTNHGWRGNGHALHHSGRGITKPVIVPRKADLLGVGRKKHDAQADQWWARAFEDTLNVLSTTKDETTGKTNGIVLDAGSKASQVARKSRARFGQSGLYSNFVRGESLCGTLEEKDHRCALLQTHGQIEELRDICNGGPKEAIPGEAETNNNRRQQKPISEDVSLAKEEYWQKFGRTDRNSGQEEPPNGIEQAETRNQRRQRKRDNRARKAERAREGAESHRGLPSGIGLSSLTVQL